MRWAVVGVGIAGRARCRAIADDPGSTVVAVWRGRFAASTGAPAASDLDGAIGAADAVAIASPAHVHADQVARALEADRHVVVETPLATSGDAARRLFALARERRKMLHVGHIELLTPAARHLRAHVNPAEISRVVVGFTGPGGGAEDRAHLAIANVARWMRLLDVAGPVVEVDPRESGPGCLAARLVLASGAPAEVDVRVAPDLPRWTRMEIDAGGARWTLDGPTLARDGAPVELPEGPGLFLEDQRHALARLAGRARGYTGERAIAHALDLAERLSKPVRSRMRCHETLRGT